MRANRSVWLEQAPTHTSLLLTTTQPLVSESESSSLNMTSRPGHPCVSVTLQIWLAGRQSSDRLYLCQGNSDSPYTHTQTYTHALICPHTVLYYNTDIRSGREWRKQGVAARPRRTEVKYVWTKGHEGSSINTVTLPSSRYGSEGC